MAKKLTAQHIIFERGEVESLDAAKRLVMAGLVYFEQGNSLVKVARTADLFLPTTHFVIQGKERFVSRGAYKLLTALEHFSLSVEGFVALDAGASTGGFTDCLLQHGAQKVYAVDVGTNQLHEKLQRDERVINLEGVNLRVAPASLLPEQVDIIVADVSFISLTHVLEPCVQWLRKGGYVAGLIKPQFEVASHQTDKGIVRDEALRQWAVDKVLAFAKEHLHFTLLGVVPSAIKGPKGNQEYIAVWQLPG